MTVGAPTVSRDPSATWGTDEDRAIEALYDLYNARDSALGLDRTEAQAALPRAKTRLSRNHQYRAS